MVESVGRLVVVVSWGWAVGWVWVWGGTVGGWDVGLYDIVVLPA